MAGLLSKLNVRRECREQFNVSVWRCPTFLFMIMGFMVIFSSVMVYFVGSNYAEDPEIVALFTLMVAAIMFAIGNIIIHSVSRLLEASRMKSQFLNIISHQLLTPLTAFKWSLNTLENEKVAADAVERSEMLAIMKENNNRMVRIINALLDISRIDNGKVKITPDKFDIAEHIKEVIALKDRELLKKQCTATFKSDNDIPLVYADPGRMRMVVENLIDNAIKFSKSNTAITISLTKSGDHVVFEIEDTGIGIPKQEHRRIFSKYFHAEHEFINQTKGLGLGLYLAKFIIEASGGKINFESEEGVGSRFWFSLPVYYANK